MSRTIELPTEIDAEKVTAAYEHGLLTLHAPKVEAAKPKQITVQVDAALRPDHLSRRVRRHASTYPLSTGSVPSAIAPRVC